MAQSFGSVAQQFQRVIQREHYSPRPCDDQYSDSLFTTFFDALDPFRVCFLQEDIQALETYRLQLDDEILNGRSAFLDAVEQRYVRGLRRADSLIKALCAKPLDFKQPDLFLDHDAAAPWDNDPDGLTRRWRCIVKERVLSRTYNRYVDSTGYTPGKLATLMGHEAEVRALVQRRSELRLQKRLEKAHKTVGTTFLECMAAQQDPHTSAFDLSSQEDFLSQLGTEKKGFGLSLEDNAQGEIEVSRIVPGGPAWKSGKVNAGDVLLSYEHGQEPEVDAALSSAAEISELMEESATDSMGFTLRKKNGETHHVRLRKEALRADENLVKSFILSGDHKVGYIQLPGFYQDWDSETGMSRGCAGDVAKELLKLQKEGIEAVVLDLRFNGGGSLREATDMAGIFIDGGPLWVARNGHNERFTVKDPNRGSAYSGPLLVLVNGASASASEFIATTLQDHGRAIVVGSTTYGKATSQSFFNVTPTGSFSAKVTGSKYYRLTGNSHQCAGVTPDILLPDPWGAFVKKEVSLPHALTSDTVLKKVYYTPAARPGLEELKTKSTARTAANADFERMADLARRYQELADARKKLRLQGQDWFAFEEKLRALIRETEQEQKARAEGEYGVQLSQVDEYLLKADSYTRSLREEQTKTLKKDPQIAECLRIIHDYIHE